MPCRYLVAGIIGGPFFNAAMGDGGARMTALLEDLCIAVIGVAAGAELSTQELQRTRRQASTLFWSLPLSAPCLRCLRSAQPPRSARRWWL